MTKFIAKIFHINEDRANRIWRTTVQAFVAFFLTFILQLLNAVLDIMNAQAKGTVAGGIATAFLTVMIAIIQNYKNSKDEDDGDTPGPND